MKYISILLSLSFSAFMLNADPKVESERQKPQIERPKPQKHFPRHWGGPPQIQVRDMVNLPANFGKGSSTLAKWISDNLKRDAEKGKPEIKPLPKPKPKPPAKPEPPKEVKDKINLFKSSQKIMQDNLRKKIDELGKKPSREEVRKTVEKYRKDNKQLIEDQKDLGKSINDWHRESKPERPSKPEPSAEIKEKISQVKEREGEMHEIRKTFQETLKSTKDLSKKQREDLIKDFKEKNADKHKAIKEAQKELQKEIRKIKQTGERRK